jgi:tetratricopeptide (TPR) repeat protein
MRLLHYLVVAVLMAGGLAASLILVPRESDLSLMYFRGHQYEDARRLYEARLAAGDRSIDVVVPLAELYVQSGEVSRAVDLLRPSGALSARHLALFQRIATYQKYGQQMQDYLRTLEAISRIEGSEEDLRELANQYRYANEISKLIPALETLLAKYPGEPAEHLELANLLAAGGRVAQAAQVLDRFEARHPQEINAGTVEFLISALVDSGQGMRAVERAGRWLDRHGDSGSVVRLTALLRTKGQLGLAAKLLKPFEPRTDADPALLTEWCSLQVAAGHAAEAFERLDHLRQRKSLPDDLTGPFLDLALAQGKTALALEVASQRGFHHLDRTLLGVLVERALSLGRADFAYRMSAALGPEFLEKRPLLAARLAYARGNRTEAAAHVARIRIESVPEDVLLETARLYVTLGLSRDSVDRFGELRRSKPAPAITQAWALVAADAGRGSEVARWIQAAPQRAIPEPLLRNLYFVAQDRKERDLVAVAANRLFLENTRDQNRLMLANALLANGQKVEALPHLRALLASSPKPDLEEAYTSALLGAIRASRGDAHIALQSELRTFWTAKLSRAGQDERQQLDVIYGLLELGAFDAVLPKLEILARRHDELVPLYVETAVKAGHRYEAVAFLKSDLTRTDLSQETREARVYALIEHGGQAEALRYIRELAFAGLPNWIAVYEDALHKLRGFGELWDFWRYRLRSGSLSADEERGIGYQIINFGQPDWARQVFAHLARNAPPDSPDVAELLFLSSLTPNSGVREWLEDRARHANGAEKGAWLSHLLDAGARDRVIAVVSSNPPSPGQGGTVLDIYLVALGQLRETDLLAKTVAREAAANDDHERLRKVARLARDAGGISAAEPAYSRLLALDPQNPEALHWLGILAHTRARYSVAKAHLGTLVASSEGGYDDNFYYAEILWREGRRSQATEYYGRALRLVERMPEPPLEARTAHAQSLFRTGNLERALREYRTVLAAAPRNGDIRADFVAMLLDAGRYDEAGDVLSGGLDSGAVRMALLRAQWLSAMARRSAAFKLIRDVAEAHPDSANVTGAMGLIEQSMGWTRSAEQFFERAVRLDPGNEDLRRDQSELARERAGQFGVEGESREIQSAQSEDVIRTLGNRLLSDAFRLQFAVEQDHVWIRSLRSADGSIAPFDGVRRRGEAGIEWESNGGTRVKGIVFTGNATLGGGVVLSRPDPKGRTTIQLDFERPNWDFAESLAQGGVRDRAEVRREMALAPSVSVRMAGAANRYALPGVADAAESVAASGGITVQLSRQPQIALDYSFDAEYRLSAKVRTDAANNSFQPLPLLSREVHAVSIQGEKQLTRRLRAKVAGGIAVDRLGGHAPFWDAGVSYDPPRHLGSRIDFDRRLYTLDTARSVTSFRAGLFWRFYR